MMRLTHKWQEVTLAGRERRPITDYDIAAELAQRLRAARDRSGFTLRRLAERTGYSIAVLSTAEQGRRTPSWEVIAAFVAACGEDPAAWRQLWELATGRWLLPRPAVDVQAADDFVQSAEQRVNAVSDKSVDLGFSSRPRRGSARVRAAFVVSLAAALLLICASDVRQPIAYLQVADDTDPIQSTCNRGAVLLDSRDVDEPASFQEVLGELSARYSPHCRMIWARFDPTPVLDHIAPHAHITLTAQRPADHAQTPFSLVYVGATVWGNMLRIGPGCVVVSIRIDGPGLDHPASATSPCLPSQHR